jgi:hypothetical protein
VTGLYPLYGAHKGSGEVVIVKSLPYILLLMVPEQGNFSQSTVASKDLALKALVFLCNHAPLLGFFDFLFFSVSVHHFVFFLLGFGSPPALSHFLRLTSIVGKVFQLLFW